MEKTLSQRLEKNIYQRINLIKKELAETKIPKSGENKHLGFKYHELSDFLTIITKLNEKHGVNEQISTTNEVATMTLTNVEKPTEQVIITVPYVMAVMQAKTDEIQKLGATLTYLRRYLYMQAYSIVEQEILEKAAEREQSRRITEVENDNAKVKMLDWLTTKLNDNDKVQRVLDDSLVAHGLTNIEELDFNNVNKEKFISTLNENMKKEQF